MHSSVLENAKLCNMDSIEIQHVLDVHFIFKAYMCSVIHNNIHDNMIG